MDDLFKDKTPKQKDSCKNYKDFEDNGPCHIAAQNGNGEALAWMHKNWELKLDGKNKNGTTPLLLCCMLAGENCESTLRVLLPLLKQQKQELIDDVNVNTGMTALHWAAYHDHENSVELLLEAGA